MGTERAASATPAVKFRGLSFDSATKSVREFARKALLGEVRDPAVFSWIDVEGGGADDLRALLAELGHDDRACRGLDAMEILPRIEESAAHISFHLHEVEDPERHLDTSQGLAPLSVARLVVVLSNDFVITFHTRPVAAVEDVRRECTDAFRLAGRTPGFIAFLLLQRCLYDYADLNLASDNYLDELDPCVSGQSHRELRGDLAVAGRNILTLKKLTTSLHIVLMLLATKRSAFVSDEGRASFRAMQDNALAVRSAVDSSRDMLDGVHAAMQTESAQRTSDTAAVLTILSAIILPLSLIAGMYGMNFTKLPGAEHPHGFWWLTAAMAGISVALVLVFRALGWIGRK